MTPTDSIAWALVIVGALVGTAIVVSTLCVLGALRSLWYPLVRAYLDARTQIEGGVLRVPDAERLAPPRFYEPDRNTIAGMFNTADEDAQNNLTAR